jgi:hypothetical protein
VGKESKSVDSLIAEASLNVNGIIGELCRALLAFSKEAVRLNEENEALKKEIQDLKNEDEKKPE